MIGLVVAALCGTWLVFAVAMGRDVYRKECARIIRQGRQVSDLDRRRAVDKAMEMVYAWPFALLLAGYTALITWERTPHSCGDCAAPVLDVIDARPERDGTDELIDRLDHEINRMRVTYPDPRQAEAKSFYQIGEQVIGPVTPEEAWVMRAKYHRAHDPREF